MQPVLPLADAKLWDIWASAYVVPATLLAMNKGVFEELKSRQPLTTAELAKVMRTGLRAAEALLALVASCGLIKSRSGSWTLSDLTSQFLIRESPFYWGPRLTAGADNDLYRVLDEAFSRDLNLAPIAEWESGDIPEDKAREFAALLHAQAPVPALAVGRLLDWSKHKKVMDVAAGSGYFCIAIAQCNAHMQGVVAELPAVCKISDEYIAKANMQSRVRTTPLNMWRDKYPEDCDAHFYSNVFHDWTDEQCRQLAEKSFRSLPSGGKIMLHEMLLNETKDGPLVVAAVSLRMLVRTRGKQFTYSELSAILASVGFKDIAVIETHEYFSVVTGTKP
jgi:acetylserotonin N-methyltransferase